jgi:hypothetical protein
MGNQSVQIDKEDLAIIMGGIKHLNDELLRVKAFNSYIIKLLSEEKGISEREMNLDLERFLGIFQLSCEKELATKIHEEIQAINDYRVS